MHLVHRFALPVLAVQFILSVQPAFAGKKVTVVLDSKGRTTSAPPEVNAGDEVTITSNGNTAEVKSLAYIPSMSDMYTSLYGANSDKAADKPADNSANKPADKPADTPADKLPPTVTTHTTDRIVIYKICGKDPVAEVGGKTATCPREKTMRLGVIVLGPHRKAIYLAYAAYDDASNPIHLQPLGDAPILTTMDDTYLVVVNKKSTEAPGDFDLTYTLKQGTFQDVAPVRPTTTQPNAKVVVTGYFADYLLGFQKKFSGEQIVDYDISAYFPSETANKVVTKVDADHKTTTESEIDTERALHKIYSGELPQVHSLYHFNITAGVVASFLRDPAFVRVMTNAKTDDAHPALYKTEQQPGSDRAMPVLMFSAYLKPMDAQVPWRRIDLLPAPTIGFSLTSPSTDFFFGISSEVLRHVQLVMGYHLGKITTLPNTQGIDDPTSSAAPTTASRFRGNFFMGATFNVDFIKGLFK